MGSLPASPVGDSRENSGLAEDSERPVVSLGGITPSSVAGAPGVSRGGPLACSRKCCQPPRRRQRLALLAARMCEQYADVAGPGKPTVAQKAFATMVRLIAVVDQL
jgi:hypothetical protein